MSRVVDDKILERFFYWIGERHRIYTQKKSGKSKPWTDDEIFLNYKFCNVFRELDDGSQWVMNKFIKPHYNDGALLFFNLIWYRSFNWIGTGDELGYLTDWDSDAVSSQLKDRRDNRCEKVFTSSHNIASHGWKDKIDRVVYGIVEPFWNDLDSTYSSMPDTVEDATKYLHKFHGFGGSGFMAFEVITDLTYTPKLESSPDVNDWTNFSPSALDALIRLFGDIGQTGKKSEIEKLELTHALLWETNVFFEKTIVPPLTLRDISHSLGEFNKYMRLLNGYISTGVTHGNESKNVERV